MRQKHNKAKPRRILSFILVFLMILSGFTLNAAADNALLSAEFETVEENPDCDNASNEKEDTDGNLLIEDEEYENVIEDEYLDNIPGTLFMSMPTQGITSFSDGMSLLVIENAPDRYDRNAPDGTVRPIPVGQSVTINGQTMPLDRSTFGDDYLGYYGSWYRDASSFAVPNGYNVILNAGAADGWTFLGWYTYAAIQAHMTSNLLLQYLLLHMEGV